MWVRSEVLNMVDLFTSISDQRDFDDPESQNPYIDFTRYQFLSTLLQRVGRSYPHVFHFSATTGDLEPRKTLEQISLANMYNVAYTFFILIINDLLLDDLAFSEDPSSMMHRALESLDEVREKILSMHPWWAVEPVPVLSDEQRSWVEQLEATICLHLNDENETLRGVDFLKKSLLSAQVARKEILNKCLLLVRATSDGGRVPLPIREELLKLLPQEPMKPEIFSTSPSSRVATERKFLREHGYTASMLEDRFTEAEDDGYGPVFDGVVIDLMPFYRSQGHRKVWVGPGMISKDDLNI
ncbi:hypothetical protein ABW19_dt0203626 [Dactylella cylindrospora]|nr:hypothetical protein ABW19_dt0203626 [Dactylella cylindrospora]